MRTLLERAAGGDRSAEAQLIEDNSGLICEGTRIRSYFFAFRQKALASSSRAFGKM